MQAGHTDREFEAELEELRRGLIVMGGRVEEMITDSVRAFAERDAVLAEATIRSDSKVNQMELDCDELCLMILAKRQPMGSDLRFITLALKMVTDLERIGDLAVNICERALDLAVEQPLARSPEIPQMAELVQRMVHDAIDAFVRWDDELARRVIASDDQVDEIYGQATRDLLDRMTTDPKTIERGIHVLSVAKWLERMADHAENLAEHVIFMVSGTDVRHNHKAAQA
ncbi:MAG: phosphate signaling complex protein PhoU [Myxococcales bacterium]|nr:phosphate signaling complex protein PhoU [Myxococcales bacterium]